MPKEGVPMIATADEREYALNFFRENGFIRKKCKECGTYFWTLNPELDTCQDAPCVEYFFHKIPVRRPLSVGEARETFLKFFEKKGHEIIPPRPVVARWREDLYLTIASIVVFQPHVTSGIVPPPANPLVISQPCIRLEDIDNVGLTMGRHLTLFEMGGHHAFNEREGRKIYWKDETVAYSFEFFTREIGIPPELLVYKESWWTGGGNAGPSFEVTVGGLEPATLVFMQYKTTNGGLERIPLEIVDTGYGIERIAWLTRKTPTAFMAIYGSLVDEFRKKLNLDKPTEDFLWASFRRAGLLDPSNRMSISLFIESIARESGLSTNDAKKVLENEVKLYTLLDHSKTISYMLADGIVPSNQGEGYLARLVIRRALKTLYLIDPSLSIVDFIEKQIQFWSADYPRLKENMLYILKVVEIEEERFKQLIREKLSKSIEIASSSPTFETFEKIYKESGIPPDIIVSEAGKRGISLPLPFDFYSKIARSSSSTSLGKKSDAESIPEWVADLPPTELLFHKDPYLRKTKARVLRVNGREIVLDKTIFYPTGGGQASDTGKITADGRSFRVTGAQKFGNIVVHRLENTVSIEEGKEVELEIDWERRFANMRHHTATHILLGTMKKILGSHVWQAGAEKTPEKGRLDITHYELPSEETVRLIEKEANRIIEERMPVNTYVLDRNEAERKYGFSIYQGGVPLQREIRIVEIPGLDVEACFGTHLSNTSEVGGIKITSVSKLQDGIVRFEYVAGTRLVDYAGELLSTMEDVASMFNVKTFQLKERSRVIASELSEYKELISSYRKLVGKLIEKALDNNFRSFGGARLVIFEVLVRDSEGLSEILKEIVDKIPEAAIVLISEGKNIEISLGKIASQELDAGRIAELLKQQYGGRGGGRREHAFIKVDQPVKVDEIWKVLENGLNPRK
ncbi:MAG: alanine--tRNA ligase [Fervidicoccaceae archaeon]